MNREVRLVTDTDVTEQVDQPEVETPETESAPEVIFPDAAAQETEGTAAEPEPEPVVDEEKPLTRAEVAELLRQERQEAERSAAERLRRDRQREEGRKAAESQRQQQEKAELAEVMGLELYKLGIPDASPDSIQPILERYASKREGHVTNRTLQEVAQAFEYAAAETLGLESDLDLSPRAETYAQSLQPFVQSVYQRAIDGVTASGDYIPKAELSKYVDAEIERRNAKAREGKEPLRRVEGTPVTTDNSLASWEQRVAHQGEDGYPMFSQSDWAAYNRVRRENGIS